MFYEYLNLEAVNDDDAADHIEDVLRTILGHALLVADNADDVVATKGGLADAVYHLRLIAKMTEKMLGPMEAELKRSTGARVLGDYDVNVTSSSRDGYVVPAGVQVRLTVTPREVP